MSEKQDLEKAVDEFAAAMKDRLEKKRKAGFEGWRLHWNSVFSVKKAKVAMINQASKGFEEESRKAMVDVANYAMMLHRKFKR